MKLPRILIIDDELGTDKDARREFCEQLALLETGGSSRRGFSYIAEATFHPGQVVTGGFARNSTAAAVEAVREGWPFKGKDGTPEGRWALVVIDLTFLEGGGGYDFGPKILAAIQSDPALRASPERGVDGDSEQEATVPAVATVMLSSSEVREQEAILNKHGVKAVAFLRKPGGVNDSTQLKIQLATLLFKEGLVEDGMLRLVDHSGKVHLVEREDERPLMKGSSVPHLRALRSARGAAMRANGARILVVAERGSGKELMAQYIHDHARAAKLYLFGLPAPEGKLVVVHLKELSKGLMSNELVGSRRGAFTGAENRDGALKVAANGTLHLDEIGNLNSGQLEMLLRIVESKTYRRLGDSINDAPERINCNIVASTNKSIVEKIEADEFPRDLYDRLDKLRLPSLSERSEDAWLLFKSFIEDEVASRRSGPSWAHKTLTQGVRDLVTSRRWAGNVRELQRVAEIVVRDKEYSTTISAEDVLAAIRKTASNIPERGSYSGFGALLERVRGFRFSDERAAQGAWRLWREASTAFYLNSLVAVAQSTAAGRAGGKLTRVLDVLEPPGVSVHSKGRMWLTGFLSGFEITKESHPAVKELLTKATPRNKRAQPGRRDKDPAEGETHD